MRGGPAAGFRNSSPLRLPDEATARPSSGFPAPYKGWNARGNLASMDPREAIVMDNMFPGVQDVSLRRGSEDWATGAPANIRTLLPYSGPSGDKLFAVTAANIYDVTAAGVIGAGVHAVTNSFWSYVNFSNSGGNWLAMVNGVDPYTIYSGAAWTTPAINNVLGADLNYLTVHQRRIWAIQKNSMDLWYLDIEAISGDASRFPVGALFKKGGHLVAIGSWTVDSGAGKDDLFAVVTSNGEIAVYGGTDPDSITTWSLIGVYDVAKPLGPRPLVNFGGDLLYLSVIGLVPMTKLTQSSLLNAADSVSFNIDGAFLAAGEDFASNFGWQPILHKTQNLLLVNVPVSPDTVSYQFVMNTITKAWCRFTGWDAACWAMSGSNIFFAGGDKVYRAWTGTNDSGAAITAQVAQAYSSFGMRGQKEISLVRPNIAFSNAVNVQIALDADFRSFSGRTELNYAPTTGSGIWGLSLWGGANWSGGPQPLDPKWTTVPGELGYLHSLRMQLVSSIASVTWTSTDFAARPAGIL